VTARQVLEAESVPTGLLDPDVMPDELKAAKLVGECAGSKKRRGMLSVRVRPKEAAVRILAPGWLPSEQELVPEAGKRRRLRIVLREDPAAALTAWDDAAALDERARLKTGAGLGLLAAGAGVGLLGAWRWLGAPEPEDETGE